MVAQINPGMGRVQALQNEGMAPHLRKGRDIATATSAITQTADQFMGMAQRMEQDRADADASIKYSEWYSGATEKPYVTTSEAMSLGASDTPNLWDEDDEGNVIERDDIALWEFLPDVAKSKYDAIVEREGKKISGPGHRKEWMTNKQVVGAEMHAKMLDTQRDELFKESIRKHELAIQTAQRAGNHGLAVSLAESHPDPAKRDELVIATVQQGETSGYHEAMLSEDPARLQDAMDYLKDPNTTSNLDPSQRSAWVNQLDAKKNQVEAANVSKRSFELDQSLAAIESAVSMGQAGYADVLDYSRWLYETGNDRHVGKSWLSSMKKKIDEVELERMQQTELDNLVANTMLGNAVMDTSDKDHRDAINRTGDALAAMGTPQANDSLFRLAKTANYLPDALRLGMAAAMNGGVPAQTVVGSAALYAKLLVDAPNIIKDIPDDTKIFLDRVNRLSRTGVPTEDAIQNIRDQMSSTDPDMLKYRKQGFQQVTGSGKARSEFEDTFKSDSKFQNVFQRYVPFGPERTAVSDRMYLDYETHLQEAMLQGNMTADEAMEYAYNQAASAYSISEINGKPEVMRRSPEQSYNLPPEDLTADYHRYLTEQFGVSEGDLGNYVLKPTMSTELESRPTYQVYSVDPEFGMLTPERDQYGPVRWGPNVKEIQKRTRDAAIEQAKADREEAARLDNMYNKEIISEDRSPLAGQIRSDEGFRSNSYMDTEGHLTGGVGHKLTEAEKKRYPEGTKIPKDVTDRWFRNDIKKAKYSANKLFKEHGVTPSGETRDIITNMVFQMGEQGVRNFKKMWANMKEGNTEGARAEMKDSKWYSQTKARADRLIERMNLG